MTEENVVETTETTEQPVDPQLQQRIAYTETLQQEIQNLREQMAQLQYQLDIRVTALVGYQSTLEVIEEPVLNGIDKAKEK
jgi:chromosome condensin MukBEF ATPase and DNA-binding subunit MukB